MIVTLSELENRDEPRRAVVGVAERGTPLEVENGATSDRERAWAVVNGAPALLGLLHRIGIGIAALVRALSS